MNNFRKILSLLLIVFLCLCLFSADESFAKKKKKGSVEITVPVRDGFNIVGKLDIPHKTTIKNKVPLVVFLHSIGADTTEMGTFPAEISQQMRTATLVIDQRGHGKSILNKKSKKMYWQNMPDKEYKKLPFDLIDVLKYIKEQYPEIDSSKVAFIGTGLGATTSLMAGSYGANAKTIILISPMLNYKGFDLRLPIVGYGNHPLLFIASKKDKYSYESCVELIKFAQGKKQLKAYPKGGDGAVLIKFQPDAKPLIINWLKEGLLSKSPKTLK